MLRLAVATQKETFERMREPLAARDIEVVPVEPSERTVSLTANPFPDVDVGFVYPQRLMEGAVADALLDVPWVNDRETVLRSRNKADVLTRLAQADVPVPRTVMASNPVSDGALVDSFRQFDPPVVLKPNSATRGAGVAKARDADSMLGIVDYLRVIHDFQTTADQSFLLQEYLPDASDVRAMVVQGEVVGAVERRLPAEALADGQWKHNVHRGADAAGIELDETARALAEETAAVLDMDYVGVDLLVTPDRTVVSETNARPTIDSASKYEDGFWDRIAALIRETALSV
jgi:ribosomal protein S6--L-glutamate ligase